MPNLGGIVDLTDDPRIDMAMAEKIGSSIATYRNNKAIEKQQEYNAMVESNLVSLLSRSSKEEWGADKLLPSLYELPGATQNQYVQAEIKKAQQQQEWNRQQQIRQNDAMSQIQARNGVGEQADVAGEYKTWQGIYNNFFTPEIVDGLPTGKMLLREGVDPLQVNAVKSKMDSLMQTGQKPVKPVQAIQQDPGIPSPPVTQETIEGAKTVNGKAERIQTEEWFKKLKPNQYESEKIVEAIDSGFDRQKVIKAIMTDREKGNKPDNELTQVAQPIVAPVVKTVEQDNNIPELTEQKEELRKLIKGIR